MKKTNENNFLIDADLLPLMEKAENGCLHSQMLLADAFGKGNKIAKNLDKKAYYLNKIYETSSDNTHKVAALWDLALIEKGKGNIVEMEKKFNIVIDFMQENIPMKEWEFIHFDWMEIFISEE